VALTASQVDDIVRALERLSRANWYSFANSPELCAGYHADIVAARWIYVPDRQTCNYPDCWSTYEALRRRYPAPAKIKFDCEDIATAHAGWLASQCLGRHRVHVGLVPGVNISHAIAGLSDGPNKPITVIDPCIWFGMRKTHYNGVVWKEVY